VGCARRGHSISLATVLAFDNNLIGAVAYLLRETDLQLTPCYRGTASVRVDGRGDRSEGGRLHLVASANHTYPLLCDIGPSSIRSLRPGVRLMAMP
jgi:hypothetical protein